MNPINELRNYLRSISPLAIALSGGVDSLTLTSFCQDNKIEFRTYTFQGPHLTAFEIEHVRQWVEKNLVPHSFLDCNPLQDVRIASNPQNRCYYCKYNLYSRLKDTINPGTTIIDGTNCSDLSKYRPGHKAIKELAIKTPFATVGYDRFMVEKLARDMQLDIPRFSRSCLFTRFDYGYQLNSELVKRLGRAEDFLLMNDISGFRIRIHNDGHTLLQIDPSEKRFFLRIQPGFDQQMQSLGFYPYQIQYMEFSKISGYFDHRVSN